MLGYLLLILRKLDNIDNLLSLKIIGGPPPLEGEAQEVCKTYITRSFPMKVAITGKGGVGKTTLSSTLARLYADEGRTVLAADVDPDANLGLALGLTQEEVDEIVPISKMRTLVEERTGANAACLLF